MAEPFLAAVFITLLPPLIEVEVDADAELVVDDPSAVADWSIVAVLEVLGVEEK